MTSRMVGPARLLCQVLCKVKVRTRAIRRLVLGRRFRIVPAGECCKTPSPDSPTPSVPHNCSCARSPSSSCKRSRTNVQPPMLCGSSCTQTNCVALGYFATISRNRFAAETDKTVPTARSPRADRSLFFRASIKIVVNLAATQHDLAHRLARPRSQRHQSPAETLRSRRSSMREAAAGKRSRLFGVMTISGRSMPGRTCRRSRWKYCAGVVG